MNPSAISTTEAVDAVFFYIFGISIAIMIGITVVMLWFLVKYNRKRHPRPQASPRYNIFLEVSWTIIPTLIVLSMFWYGWEGYTTLTNVPKDALEVKVSARMWSWVFTYPNGVMEDRLVIPAGRAISLSITSEDVLHSFYVPAFRVKRDAVPGMTTRAWFRAPEPGTFDLFCAEYCGVGHSAMITTIEAMPEEEFEEWLRHETFEAEGAEGEELLSKYGCIGCHSLDGSKSVGPTFQDLFGREVTVVTDGERRTVTADAEYIQKSIFQPQADLVEGYPPVMPSFEGQITPQEMEKIIEYFTGSDENGGARNTGESLVREKGCLGCHSTDGSKSVGPTFQGIFGREVTVEREGKTQTLSADEEYLRESIHEPKAAIVQGFPPVMPSFADLSEEELKAIVDYIRELQ